MSWPPLRSSVDLAEIYDERVPVAALAGRVRTVWVQRIGAHPYLQRNLPTGGVELIALAEVPHLCSSNFPHPGGSGSVGEVVLDQLHLGGHLSDPAGPDVGFEQEADPG